MYEIEIYQDKNGKSEIKEYIKNLQKNKNKDSNIKFNKIIEYIKLLKENGLNLGSQYIKHLDEEIWQLRPIRDRILFAYYGDNKFVLLSVFLKRTQKTPKREIEKAKKMLEDYKKGGNNNERKIF